MKRVDVKNNNEGILQNEDVHSRQLSGSIYDLLFK